jgi:cation:H+ antiporter
MFSVNDRAPHLGRGSLRLISAAMAATTPAIALRISHPDLPHPLEAVVFGLAIVSSAFLLAWGAEAAQVDISAGLAIAVLAFIAVLPEYAVDMVFSWKGGRAFKVHGLACKPPGSADESPCTLALANMTGANRLLIGIGWSLVVFLGLYQWKKRSMPDREVKLDRSNSVEISYLALASIYGLSLPLKRSLTLIDAAILVTIFVAYTVRIAKAPAEEPHLVGPARWIGSMPTRQRRTTYVGLLIFAAVIILLCAESFAEALVATGESAGISEFLLVQWLAPLASEAPELLIAGLFAWRLATSSGLSTLVSSKVNQWTLLVGTLPIVFSLASGSWHGLPLDSVQREELFLTAAQAIFGVAVLVSLSLSVREATMLFVLFWAQFVIGAVVPERLHAAERVGVGIVYLVFAVMFILKQRVDARRTITDGFRTSYALMQAEDG